MWESDLSEEKASLSWFLYHRKLNEIALEVLRESGELNEAIHTGASFLEKQENMKIKIPSPFLFLKFVAF